MVDFDHSVVYRRGNGAGGSGTVVHFSSSFLVLEIYEKQQEIRLNEIISKVRVSRGQVVFYDGKAVVCDVVDSSSIQLVTLYLHESCIAVGGGEGESDNSFAFEHFLDGYVTDLELPLDVERKLYRFAYFLSALVAGLKVSRVSEKHAGESFSLSNPIDVKCKIEAISVGCAALVDRYKDLCKTLQTCREEDRSQVGNFFKHFLFPLSTSSSIFRYFHSAHRCSYISYRALSVVKSNSQFTLGDFKGYLLDEFIRRCAGFESIELRSRHWIRVIRERLETHAGPIRILFLGSDTSLNMIAEAFSVSEIERLEFDVFCPDSECTDALKKGIVGGSCGANELMRVQFIRESVHRLLQLHFAGDTGAFATYDLILSTSFIESLANKNAVYLIAFALRLLRERGNLMLFSGQEDYSPLREHWLLWFNHCLETKDWRSYLSFGVNWTQTDFEYGKLTVFESTSEN